MKQIAIGIKQYIQDYDERYPMASWNLSGGSPSLPIYGWSAAIQPYVKSDQIYQCPSQANRDNVTPTIGTDAWGYSDYFYNSNLGHYAFGGSCPDASTTGKFTVNEAEVDSSSNVVMTGDGGRGGQHNLANYPPRASYTAGTSYVSDAVNDNNVRPAYHYTPGWYTHETATADANSAGYAFSDGKYMQQLNDTHLEGMNIGFVDGHVKWLKPEKLTFNDPNGSNTTFKVNATNGGSGGRTGCSN